MKTVTLTVKCPTIEKLLDDEADHEVPEGNVDGFIQNPIKEKQFLVFTPNQNSLLKDCQKCGDVVNQQKRKTVGSMLSSKFTCHCGCKKTWESQPVVKRKPLENLLQAASILFTGNNCAPSEALPQV